MFDLNEYFMQITSLSLDIFINLDIQTYQNERKIIENITCINVYFFYGTLFIKRL